MSLIGQSPALFYVAFGLFAVAFLIRLGPEATELGHRVLNLLRDLREFRQGR